MKSIFTYQNKKIASSLLVFFSQLLFCFVIKKINSDDTITTSLLIAFGASVGNYIAFTFNDRFKKDSKWMVALCSSDVEDILKLCNYLVDHGIKYQSSFGLTRKGKLTINVLAFSKTKTESRLIDKYLEETDSKYLKEIMK